MGKIGKSSAGRGDERGLVEKEGATGEPVSIVLKTSFRPLVKRNRIDDVKRQNVKCQNVNIFGVELLARVSRLHNV